MDDLVEELHKHSNYLYGPGLADCRSLMRRAAVEIKRLRAAQVGAETVEKVAKALAGYDASGHNDAPLYEDYDDFNRAIYRDKARWALRAVFGVGADVGADEYPA